MQPQLEYLLNNFIPPPAHWFDEGSKSGTNYALPPLPCTTYADLIDTWRKAMIWSDSLDITLSAMLAIVASTKQRGTQVWLRVIGPPSSGKSTLCEAVSANSKYVFPLSLLTGLHSGFRDGKSDEDASIIPRLDGMTAVINEGDMLLKAPNRDQTMAEMRDLHLGVARNFYRNRKEAVYTGHRSTWILAGTPAIRQLNKSALGDRFIDCIVYERPQGHVTNEERKMVKEVTKMGLRRMRSVSDGKPESFDDELKINAYRKTAGYINYLREQGPPLIDKILEREDIIDSVSDDCAKLAELVAAMRTRTGQGDEDPTEPELAHRLSEQLSKTGVCMSVVLNKPTVDSEVMRRVAHLAEDTCFGTTWNVCRTVQQKGLEPGQIANVLRVPQELVRKALGVLRTIGAVRIDDSPAPSGARNRNVAVYRLSVQQTGLMAKLRSLLTPRT